MTEPGSKPTSFFDELKRRRVIRVAIAYAAVVFVVLQGADLVFPALGVSDSLYRLLVVISLIGFPVVLVLAWLFDLTPEGVRLTRAVGEGDLVVARFRPWAVYGLSLAAVAAVIAIGWYWVRPGVAMGEVAAGADVIAVLPFDVRGEGLEVMADGMVDLLSRNLDEVGAIRTIDPRTVLSRWNQRASAGIELDDALQLGGAVEAGSILWGSVTAVGGDVRIAADLYTLAGAKLASVTVDGSSEEVLALVDSFSVALLREVWRSRRPVPSLNVAAITTGDPEAIRAYLQGERFYRASQWDSAVAAFQRAVAADSAFALAHYKTARALLWTSGTNNELARQAADLAYLHGDRLPARERTLVLVQELRLSGRQAEADDSLQGYLNRYPDDPEALFVWVDNEYHRRSEDDPLSDALTPAEERLRPFLGVLQLDPTYTPALVHALGIALESGDSTLIAQFLSALKLAAPENTVAQEAYEIVARAVLHPGDLRSLTQAIDRVLRLNPTARDLTWQVRRAAENPLVHLSLALPEPSQRELIGWLRPRVDEDPRDAYRVTLLGRLFIASGRIAAGWQFFDSLEWDATIAQSYRQRASLMPSDLGYVDEEFYERTGRELSDGARLRMEMLAAIDRGQPGGLREMIDQARARERETDAPIWGTRAAASEGFLRALEGEPAAGLALVDSALAEYSSSTEPFRFRWLEWLVRYPETRAEARPLLNMFWPGEPAYVVPRYYLRGRLLEAEGDTAAALQSYRRFLESVAGADPGLLLQLRVDSARAAIRRLGAAGVGG